VTNALLLSGGTAPYSDPWHPFAETSIALERLATEVGFEVEVSRDPVSRLVDLDGVDVIIANIPEPSEPVEGLEDAAAGLRKFLSRPGGIVALHVSVTTLLGLPDWSAAIGARWATGTMHPPRGVWPVRSVASHPLAPATPNFELDDELYSFMAWDAPADSVVEHELDGSVHPLVWTREVGPTRVVADALGHAAASYDSAEHAELLRRALRWAARQS
jgi:hypothetical protein